MKIVRAGLHHAQPIADIYNYYIDNTVVTFETERIPEDEMRQRIEDKLNKYNWLVGENNGQVIGYAYYGQFRGRCAYDATVESSIYIDYRHTGKGYGKQLYQAIIDDARNRGFREMIGGVSLPNEGSVALHEKLGFEKAGHFKNVGLKFDKWIDVGFWQKSLY